MDRDRYYHDGRWSGFYAYRYAPYPYPLRPEPWSRRGVITTWAVTAALVVAGATAAPALRDRTERSWCSGGGKASVSQRCLAEQKAIRCEPFGLLHCPRGDD
jgi:hypothetical protein